MPCLSSAPLTAAHVPQDAEAFALPGSFEEGKEKCPYDPARGFTGLIIGEWAPPSGCSSAGPGAGCVSPVRLATCVWCALLDI